jgi:hypothetical protein
MTIGGVVGSELEFIGRMGEGDRDIHLLVLDEPELPPFRLPSTHYTSLIVADFSGNPAKLLLRAVMKQGAVHVTGWGPGSATMAGKVQAEDCPVPWPVKATWFEHESLATAVSSFLDNLYPDDSVDETCHSGLAVVVGSPHWGAEVRRLLLEAKNRTPSKPQPIVQPEEPVADAVEPETPVDDALEPEAPAADAFEPEAPAADAFEPVAEPEESFAESSDAVDQPEAPAAEPAEPVVEPEAPAGGSFERVDHSVALQAAPSLSAPTYEPVSSTTYTPVTLDPEPIEPAEQPQARQATRPSSDSEFDVLDAMQAAPRRPTAPARPVTPPRPYVAVIDTPDPPPGPPLSGRDLFRKLLITHNVTEVERATIPHTGIPFSVVKEIVEDALATTSWFPLPREQQARGAGVVIEARAGQVWVHEHFGDGSELRSRRVSSVTDAVRAYIRHHGDPRGVAIDGVTIDYAC